MEIVCIKIAMPTSVSLNNGYKIISQKRKAKEQSAVRSVNDCF